ncbi:MAG: hypothetical protein A2Z34_09135 [Planctomycetes bacterium RBG_16_59_8]|nr:MAG: hypothetical protein A2Z34_09135 [Planctomycetes bacterium RBG_16_59_8]
MKSTRPWTIRKSRLLREEMITHTLSCGLKAVLIPRRGFRQKVFLLTTRYGSIDIQFRIDGDRDVTKTPAGVAHYLEHQLFKKRDRNILVDFGREGASSNAFTSACSTAFYVSCTEGTEKNLATLLDVVFSPFFSDENVTKERTIIEQELRMYQDLPDHRCFANLLDALYHAHPARLEVGGTVESIQSIDRNMLEACHRTFYTPENMLLVASGDLDAAKLFVFLEKRLGDLGVRGGLPAVRRDLPEEPPSARAPRAGIAMSVSRPCIAIGFKDSARVRKGAEIVALELATNTILDAAFGKGSLSYDRLYRKGLIDDSFSASFAREESFGHTVIGGETDDPDRLAEAIADVLRGLRRKGFNRRDIERLRRRRLGRYVRAFDSPEEIVFFSADSLLKGVDPFDFPALIKGVKRGALFDRLESHFIDGNFSTSLITPAGA